MTPGSDARESAPADEGWASDEHSNQVNSRNMLLVPSRMFIVVLTHDGRRHRLCLHAAAVRSGSLSGESEPRCPGADCSIAGRGTTVQGPGKASRLERDFNSFL